MNELDLSVVIITLNEEHNIERCLKSLPKGVEIIILDSESTDQTVNIARTFGAKVEQREFDNYSNQKNAAINLATRSWVFSLDADEELDANLVESLEKISKSDQNFNAYKIQRELVFMNRKMKFGKTKDSPIRLFKKSKAKFIYEIHEVLDVEDNSIGNISGILFHYSYKNIDDYFKRFNSYTSKIALRHYSNGKKVPSIFILCSRPFVEFINRYFIRFGFLDGYEGFCYALYSSVYAFTKYAKLLELKRLEGSH